MVASTKIACNYDGNVDNQYDMENNVVNVEVVPYTECAFGMEAQPFTSSVLAPKLFVEKVCSQGKKVTETFPEYDEDENDAAGDPPCENAP